MAFPPNTFASQSGNVPAAELDQNFAACLPASVTGPGILGAVASGVTNAILLTAAQVYSIIKSVIPFEVTAFMGGTQGGASWQVLRYQPSTAVILKTAACFSSAGVATTSFTEFFIQDNGVEIGTVVYGASDSSGTVALLASPYTLAAGHILTIVAAGQSRRDAGERQFHAGRQPELAAMPTLILPAGTTKWTVPSDWSSVNTIGCLGPGGNGFAGNVTGEQETGGSAGSSADYAVITNQTLTPGTVVSVQVGAGGSQNNTWWKSTATVMGAAGRNATTTGGGAAPTGSVGTTIHHGAAGGSSGLSLQGAGGAGAGGPTGGGKTGANGSLSGSGGGGSNGGSSTAGAVGVSGHGGAGGAGTSGSGGGAGGTSANGSPGTVGGGGGGWHGWTGPRRCGGH